MSETNESTSSMQNSLESLKLISKKIEEAKNIARTEGESLLKESFKKFFEKHPEIKSIRWTQYTPYFNDGDACTFSMNGWEAKVNMELIDSLGIPNELLKIYKNKNDEDEYYGYGDSCFIYSLKSHELTESNKRWKKREELYEYNEKIKNIIEDFDELNKACCSLEEEVMMEVLGDHVEVTATIDGFNIDDYDHE